MTRADPCPSATASSSSPSVPDVLPAPLRRWKDRVPSGESDTDVTIGHRPWARTSSRCQTIWPSP
eukprot:CAMPEP_0180403752 /NCGR_PEP_ID=MMETSP0989-20121125/39608_1 /TAXON_ID=697907 /ORGANISM="non described non described, Strain CCMP2293" /LENGTH=64 /DNA_ID=CAMNT_0022407039 /DNA_START=17 /DNA_END=211 /DNA_ORIENTATION=+